MGREQNAMSSEEARQTLKTLEQLIVVATWMNVRKPEQRAALEALRRRRTALRRLLAKRSALVAQPVVPLAAWRARAACTSMPPSPLAATRSAAF